jgi:hypothetical protein
MSRDDTAGNSSTCHIVRVTWLPECEFTYTTVAQEALETTDALLHQSLKITRVAWNNAAIEANVDPTLTLGSFDLNLEVLYGSRRRDGIQWHVDHSGHSTKGSGSSTSPEAFPFCPARLIEVNMRVDKSRKDDVRRVIGI